MGFVKLSNSLPDWAWYHDNNTLAVYIRLLMGAVWQDTGYQNVILKRGQTAATIPKIAAQSGLTVQQTRTVLNRLKATGKITVENTSKFSIITLIDYDCDISNSNSQTTDEQQAGNSQTTDEQQVINRKSTVKTTAENTSKFSIIAPIGYDCGIKGNSQNNSQSTGEQQTISNQNNKRSIDEQQKINSPTLLNTENRIQKAENININARTRAEVGADGSVYDKSFELFWSAYPKKTAKKNAYAAWQKIKPDYELVRQILSALEQQKQSVQWQKDDGQFIPYPATWLNGKRWEDDVKQSVSLSQGCCGQAHSKNPFINAVLGDKGENNNGL